jgi:hypothetical protein
MSTATVRALAAIEEVETTLDGQVNQWSVTENFGEFTQEFNLSLSEQGLLQVGSEVKIAAGYDRTRIHLMTGIVDTISEEETPTSQSYSVSGRVAGARELMSTRITKTWHSIPYADSDLTAPTTSLFRAHQIIQEAAGSIGIGIRVLEFHDYRLFNDYVAVGKTILEIIADLIQPWNLFTRTQYVPIVEDRYISVRKIDWSSPPSGGVQVKRTHRGKQNRQQTAYQDDPRLNEVAYFFIRGAAYTIPRTNFGIQTRVEYFRNVVSAEVSASIAGQVPVAGEAITTTGNTRLSKAVTTETTVTEQSFGDKVLNREESVYMEEELSSRTKDRFWYYEPGTVHEILTADVETFVAQSLNPSPDAHLFMASSRREGYVDVNGGGTRFQETERGMTTYYYDSDGGIACEVNVTQKFDEDTGTWGNQNVTIKTHSQTSGASVRTQRSSFTFEDSKFKLDTVAVQQVGGARPKVNYPNTRKMVQSVQAQSPQGEIDANGNVIDPGEGLFVWNYENPYIGQTICDQLYQLALDEKTFQLAGYRWETINFESILQPDLHHGMPVSVEVSSGVYKDFLCETVAHSGDTTNAKTTGTAKRLTRDSF